MTLEALPWVSCSSADDVYGYLSASVAREVGDGENAYALFEYALVERDRLAWVEHVHAACGEGPSAERIETWFRDKPAIYFDEKLEQADDWLTRFARAALAAEFERARTDAVARAIGDLGRFWPNFWTGNLIGITSNVAFAALVVLFVVVINTDFSFIAWARRLFGFQ